MEQTIIKIIIRLTGYSQLNENKDIDLIENEILDSLAFIELITALEEEFNIEIQPTQVNIDTWRNIKSITEYIENLVNSK